MSRSESTPSPPTISTNSYVFDRVERIEVFVDVPTQLTEVGSLDGWRSMARQEAYEKLFAQVSADELFTVECRPIEKNETSPDGKHHFSVGCELRFTRNKYNK